MSCNSNTPNINKTFIIEPLSLTGGSPTLSACTSLYTNLIQSCSGDTTITMGTGLVTFNSNVNGINSFTANTIEATTYLSGGTNILDIVNANDTFVTGGTFNDVSDTLTLVRNDGANIVIGGLANYYVTGGTYNNNTGLITFDRNDALSAFTVDLSSIDLNDTFVTGATLNAGTLTITRNDGVDIVVTGFSKTFTGNTISECISDIYVSNIHSCSPLRVNPNDEGNVYFGSTSGVTIDILNTRIGIGTNNPLETLHVSGNTFIDGGLKVTNITAGESINNLGIDGSGNFVIGDDTFITGGTYNQDSGILTLLDNATNSINIDGFFTGVTISNTLFVDENGDDSTGEKGRLDKPFKTLYGAKTASTSGDLIYVLPQTIVFDNSDSTGNKYNGIWQTELNLWKDGITYYFSPGVKINMFNQSVSGEDLGLFYPGNSTGETCTVLGYLEFEATGLGPDSFNGKSRYFLSDGNTDSFNFYSETKSLKSNSCELLGIYDSTGKCVFNLKSDEEYRYTTGGNVGSGAVYVILGIDIDFYSYVKRRYYYQSAFSFYLRSDCTTSNINIDGEYMISLSSVLLLRDFKCNNVNVNISDIYYQNAYTPFLLYGSIVSTQVSSGGWTLNMNSNLYDYSENSLTTGLFWLNHSNNIINYKGTITTKTNSGTGRFIVSSSSGNIVNIDGDIKLLGTGTTSNVIMQSFGTSKVNFKGNIEGNFNYTFHPRFGGEINVNNSKIISTADRFILYDHTDTTTSTFRLNNSYVNGYNDLNSYGDGQYLNVLINNSNIVNTGSGDTLNNTTNFGRLQVVNSSIYSNSGLSINYPTTSEVITSNLTVNTDYSATTHSGEITKLTDLIY